MLEVPVVFLKRSVLKYFCVFKLAFFFSFSKAALRGKGISPVLCCLLLHNKLPHSLGRTWWMLLEQLHRGWGIYIRDNFLPPVFNSYILSPRSVVGVSSPVHVGLCTEYLCFFTTWLIGFKIKYFERHERCQFLKVWALSWSSVISPIF